MRKKSKSKRKSEPILPAGWNSVPPVALGLATKIFYNFEDGTYCVEGIAYPGGVLSFGAADGASHGHNLAANSLGFGNVFGDVSRFGDCQRRHSKTGRPGLGPHLGRR